MPKFISDGVKSTFVEEMHQKLQYHIILMQLWHTNASLRKELH